MAERAALGQPTMLRHDKEETMKAKVDGQKFKNQGTSCRVIIQNLPGVSVIHVGTRKSVTREHFVSALKWIDPIIKKFVKKKPTIIHVGNVSLLAWRHKGATSRYLFNFPKGGLQIN